MGLVGEPRVGRRQGDGLVRQTEHGRAEAPPHTKTHRRGTGEVMDQRPEAGRRQPDARGGAGNAIGHVEALYSHGNAGVDHNRRRQQVPVSKVGHGLTCSLAQVGGVDHRPPTSQVLDRAGIEWDGSAESRPEALVPRIDEHRELARRAAGVVGQLRREDHSRPAPAGRPAGAPLDVAGRRQENGPLRNCMSRTRRTGRVVEDHRVRTRHQRGARRPVPPATFIDHVLTLGTPARLR